MIFLKFRELIATSPAKRDKIIVISLILALVINVAIWLAYLIKFFDAPEYIILHYNVYFGISDLDIWYKIFIPPLLGLLIIFVNFVLSFHFYLKKQTLSHLLSISALAFNLILAGACFLLIYINI